MSAALWIAVAVSAAPTSEPVCGPARTILRGLANGYEERIAAIGNAAAGGQVLLVLGPDGRSWSVVRVEADGRTACILMVGNGWRDVRPPQGKGREG